MPLLLANGAHKLKSARLPAIWFVTDETRVPDIVAAIAALPRGTGVIFRHYGALHRDVLARKVAALCRARGLIFVVAQDWRLAAMVRADGVHLPEHAVRGWASGARLWRRMRGTLLTVAAHGARGLAEAGRVKASAALLAPVFPTASHPGRAALGLVRAAALIRHQSVPVYALGGAGPKQLAHVRAAGFAGIAGISFAVKETR
jgi:thiamine-phosphate pyrophosphorylase